MQNQALWAARRLRRTVKNSLKSCQAPPLQRVVRLSSSNLQARYMSRAARISLMRRARIEAKARLASPLSMYQRGLSGSV